MLRDLHSLSCITKTVDELAPEISWMMILYKSIESKKHGKITKVR